MSVDCAFSVGGKNLLSQLQRIAGVVDHRAEPEIYRYLCLTTDSSKQQLTAVAMGQGVELCIVVHDVNVITEGACVVPASKLMDVLKTLPDEELNVSQADGKVTLRQKGRQFNMQTLPAPEFPLLSKVTPLLSVELDGKALSETINAVAFSMAHDDVRTQLNGLLLEIGKTHAVVAAMDGFRLSVAKTPLSSAIEGGQAVLLHRKVVKEWLRHLSAGAVKISVDDNRVTCVQGDLYISLQRQQGVFPQYRKVLSGQAERYFTVSRESLIGACQRVRALSSEKTRSIRLNVSGNELTLSAQNQSQDTASEVLAVNAVPGEEYEVGFNVEYLLDSLKAVTESEVQIGMPGGSNATLIVGAGEPAARYILMPVRL